MTRGYRKVSDVALDLEARIREGAQDYRHGVLLAPICDLAVAFGTSRKTMRRALALEVKRGWVTPSLDGPRVTAPEPGDPAPPPERLRWPRWDEVLAFLKAIEPEAATRAAVSACRNAVGRKRLAAAAHRLEANTRNPSPHAAFEENREFHMAVAVLCEHRKLQSSIQDCYAVMPQPQKGKAQGYRVDGMSPSPLLLCMDQRFRDEMREQHRRIARAVMAGQGETARAAMLEHLACVEKKFRELKGETDKGN